MRRSRIEKEKALITLMIAIYCKGHHRSKMLCPDCVELSEYALKRLSFCKFGDKKTSCRKCPIKCYQAKRRAQIKKVMRYSGSRFIYYHPIETMKHLFY